MAEFLYRCKSCGAEITTNWSTNHLGDCPTKDCEGLMRRVWSANFATTNLKEARK